MRLINALTAAITFGLSYAQDPFTTGFNYGNINVDGSIKILADYVAEFNAAKALPGTNGQFTSARLYTTVQGMTGNKANEAILAAINTQTRLLLGFWCSGTSKDIRDQVFNNELAALKDAFTKYGPSLEGLVQGISVGSEDLYRNSVLDPGKEPGATPEDILEYVQKTKTSLKNDAPFKDTWAENIKVGHVDTWNAYTQVASSQQVIPQLDFVGMNAFPYFQQFDDNSPDNLANLFQAALDDLTAAVGGKQIWVTETGYPMTGPIYNKAAPGPTTADLYYHKVGCGKLFGRYNTWWYIQFDAPTANSTGDPNAPGTPPPSFGVTPPTPGAPPFYSLDCAAAAPSAPAVSATGSVPTSANASSILPEATPSVFVGGNQFPNTSAATTFSTVTSSRSSSSAGPSSPSKSCPADLAGSYEFPHLIVPVSSTTPNTPAGTQYFGTVDSTTSTLYNFDVNPDLAGKTCSVVFLFPRQDQLVWSSYTFNGQGGLSVASLSSPASSNTDYSNAPNAAGSGSVGTLQPGNGYVVSSGPCQAGQTIGYRVDSTGGLALKYFQDRSPAAPIGLYIRAC